MQRNTLEIVMGALVLLVAVVFMSVAYEAADIKGGDGYEIEAEFGGTGGLSVGDDVRISGIKVGRITRQDCGRITKTSVCSILKFRMLAASICVFGTDSRPERMISDRKAVDSRQTEIVAMPNRDVPGTSGSMTNSTMYRITRNGMRRKNST